MPLNTGNYPHAGGEFIEQATAAPGEKREIQWQVPPRRCSALGTLDHWASSFRCSLDEGHEGPHSETGVWSGSGE